MGLTAILEYREKNFFFKGTFSLPSLSKIVEGKKTLKRKRRHTMKKMMRMLTVVAVVIAMVSTAQLVYAGPVWAAKDAHGGGKKGEHFQKLIEQLDITDEQKKVLTEQRDEHWKKMKELREAMNENRKDLREELLKSDYSKTAVNRTVGEMKELQGEMIEQRVDHFLQIKEVLTPQQYKKITEHAEKKRHPAKKGRRAEKYGEEHKTR